MVLKDSGEGAWVCAEDQPSGFLSGEIPVASGSRWVWQTVAGRHAAVSTLELVWGEGLGNIVFFLLPTGI